MKKDFNFEELLKKKAAGIEKRLHAYIKALPDTPAVLRDSMAYSVDAGGKRLRPFLVNATAEAFGLSEKDSMPAACALEMVHTYSLIHDDLPAMDNDDLRRGKPTNHKVFGEPLAILAGDALLTFAFETIALCAENKKIGAQKTAAASRELARTAGASGMVGGQAADIFAEGFLSGESRRMKGLAVGEKNPSYFMLPNTKAKATKAAVLEYIHIHKTGALLQAGVTLGAILGGAKPKDLKNIREYGFAAGVAFQITDDMLDVTADKKKLGKRGSDKDNDKLTFVTLYGLEESRTQAQRWIKRAVAALDRLEKPSAKSLEPLYGLAGFVLERSY